MADELDQFIAEVLDGDWLAPDWIVE